MEKDKVMQAAHWKPIVTTLIGLLFAGALSMGACQPPEPDCNVQPTPCRTADAGQEAVSQPDATTKDTLPDAPAPTEKQPETSADNTSSPEPTTTGLTWYKNVLPLFQKHCFSCHSQGGIGPFTLTKHEDVKSKLALIKWSVESKRMPPWMPDHTGAPITDVRQMSAQDIATVVKWVDAGGPAGNPKDAPPYNPQPQQLEWVDKTVAPALAHKPAKVGDSDDYHCLVIDPQLKQDRDLIGYEVVPGVKAIVHHVLIYPVDLAAAKAKEQVPGAGYTCYGGPGVPGITGINRLIGGWVPGTTVTVFPKGTGMRLPKGVGLVMQIHYNFDNAPSAKDLTTLRLQFAKEPIPASKQLRMTALSDTGLAIPGNNTEHKESNTITSPKARVWGVLPHMHAMGTKISVTITRKDGTKETIINIPKWDFNWQQSYFFSNANTPQVEAGDKVTLNCWFKNNTGKTVTWGESTTEEMCLNYFYTTRQ
jgi:mono/diheme cytochrome c family protein